MLLLTFPGVPTTSAFVKKCDSLSGSGMLRCLCIPPVFFLAFVQREVVVIHVDIVGVTAFSARHTLLISEPRYEVLQSGNQKKI